MGDSAVDTRWIRTGIVLVSCVFVAGAAEQVAKPHRPAVPVSGFDDQIQRNAARMIEEGRKTFRYDTFGDEVYWGDALQLHRAIEGEKHGGVGPGVSPKTALAVGLKVDVDALPADKHSSRRGRSISTTRRQRWRCSNLTRWSASRVDSIRMEV